jgi:death-on-curing protein
LLNKNHPFANGNKRIALTALLVFLFLNGKWLIASQDDLFSFAMGVAASEARRKDLNVEEIKIFLTEHMVATGNVDMGPSD